MMKNSPRTKDNREINLIDLLIEILLHWRGLIISALLCGIILGGYGYYELRRQRITESQATQTEPQSQPDREELLSILYSRLTAKEKSGINLMLDNYDQVQRWEKLFESSAIMKGDPFNMPEGSVTLRVEADPEIISDIYNAYSSTLISLEMYETVREKLGWEDNINEQIVIWNEGSVENSSFLKEFRFYALSEDDCIKLQDAFIEYAFQKSSEYESTIGNNTITIYNRNVTVIFDSLINDKQKNAHTNKTNLENVITTTYDTLSFSGKAYYDIYTGKIESVDLSAESAESAETDGGTAVGIKRMFTYGLLGGTFGSILIVSVLYIFTNRLRDTDSFNVTYGINQIGRVFRSSKKKWQCTPIDKAIYSLKRKGRNKVRFEDAIENVALSTAVAAKRTETKKMGIYCVDKEDILAPRIAELLRCKGIDSVIIYCPIKLEESNPKLDDIDSVIIIAKPGISGYYDVWDIVEMVESQNIRIIGGIMA